MGKELGAMLYQWIGNQEPQYINGQGIRSYDISMVKELGATIYQSVGIRSYDISMGREYRGMIYQ